jgi:hypothetical protein
MPLPLSEDDVVEFTALVEQLSKRLSFDDRGKLASFVRGAVQGVLKVVEAKTGNGFEIEEAVFQLIGSVRTAGVGTKLGVFHRSKGSGKLDEICSLVIKDSTYRGRPDGSAKTGDTSKIPPLVMRKRIGLSEVKLYKSGLWISVAQLLRTQKSVDQQALELDVECGTCDNTGPQSSKKS